MVGSSCVARLQDPVSPSRDLSCGGRPASSSRFSVPRPNSIDGAALELRHSGFATVWGCFGGIFHKLAAADLT